MFFFFPPLVHVDLEPKLVVTVVNNAQSNEIKKVKFKIKVHSLSDNPGQFQWLSGEGPMLNGKFVHYCKSIQFGYQQNTGKDDPVPLEFYSEEIIFTGKNGKIVFKTKPNPTREWVAYMWTPPKAITLFWNFEFTQNSCKSSTNLSFW